VSRKSSVIVRTFHLAVCATAEVYPVQARGYDNVFDYEIVCGIGYVDSRTVGRHESETLDDERIVEASIAARYSVGAIETSISNHHDGA
jgi:hypothetical protein